MRPARYVIPVARNGRLAGTGERLEELAITEAEAQRQLATFRVGLISTHIELVHIVSFNRRRDEICRGRCAIRVRIERGNCAPDGMLCERWKERERLTAEWIARRRQHASTEVSGTFGKRGHSGDPRDAFAPSGGLVIRKEERLAADQRAARRCTGLVPLVMWRRLACRGEHVSCVEGTVSRKPVRGSVDSVGARFGDHVHLRARIAAKRRVVGACQHLELADRVHSGTNGNGIELWIDILHAVKQEAVEVLARTVCGKSEVAPDGGRRAGRGGCGAGREQTELEKITSIERQHLQLDAADRRSKCTTFLKRQLRGAHAHDFGDITDLELHVDAPLLIDLELQLTLPCLVPRSPRLDDIAAGCQCGHREVSFRPAHDVTLRARSNAADRDPGIAHRAA